MTRERAIELLSDVTVLDDPEMEEAHKIAISALRQQEPKVVEIDHVKPLTLDELREAAKTGDPVWLVGMEDGDGWRRIDYVELLTIGYSCFGDPESWCFRTTGYGVRVFAYRQKLEEGTV